MQVGPRTGLAAAAALRLGLSAEVHQRAKQHSVLLPGQKAVPGRRRGQGDCQVS